jgi:hypothetical protein
MSTSVQELVQTDIEAHEAGIEPTLRFLESPPIAGTFATEELRKNFLTGLTPDSLETFLSGLNASVRGLDTGAHSFDGDDVKVTMAGMVMSNPDEYLPPRMEDRHTLLSFALQKAQQSELHDSGMALGIAVTAGHLFGDGNGRTSRLVYTLFAEGYDGSDEAKERVRKLLTAGEGRKSIDLQFGGPAVLAAEYFAMRERYGINMSAADTPNFITSDKVPFVGEWTAANIQSSNELQDATRKALAALLNEDKAIVPAFALFLKNNPKFAVPGSTIIPKSSKAARAGQIIVLDEILPLLGQEQYEELISNAYQIKTEAIKVLIDSVTGRKPGEQQRKIGKMSLHSFFVQNSNNLIYNDIRSRR